MDDVRSLQNALDRIELLEEQNASLRRLLDDADKPKELRHRQRNTITLLRLIIHGTANGRRRLEDYVSRLDDRLEAIVRAQSMVDTQGAVDLRTLLAEQMRFYSEGDDERLTLDGPDVTMVPRIGQAVALAMHELAVNSVDFGSLSGEGKVTVHWTATASTLTITWREVGLGIHEATQQGFGFQYITKALPYQLGAFTSLSVKEGVVLCVLTIPL